MMEEWTRIVYLLPVTTTNDRTAYLRVLNCLRSKHPQVDLDPAESPITGFTHTLDDPPAFGGFYWSETLGDWVPDSLALLFLDRAGSTTEADPAIEDARRMKSRIGQFYSEEGSPQDEVWCTVQQIHLV